MRFCRSDTLPGVGPVLREKLDGYPHNTYIIHILHIHKHVCVSLRTPSVRVARILCITLVQISGDSLFRPRITVRFSFIKFQLMTFSRFTTKLSRAVSERLEKKKEKKNGVNTSVPTEIRVETKRNDANEFAG